MSINPKIYNPSIDDAYSGWGRTYKFDVTFEDTEAEWDMLNVTLLVNTSGTNYLWEGINSTTLNATSPKVVEFNNTFECDDIGSNYYKFNVTDIWGNYNETSAQPFTLRNDYVEIFEASNFDINRSGNDTVKLVLRIHDTDRNVDVPAGVNGTIWVMANDTTWGPGFDNQTNATGHLVYNFNATCAYLFGPRQWKGGTNNDDCYEATNTTDLVYVYINGTLKESLLNPLQDQQFNVSQGILIRFNTTSECSNEDLIPNASAIIELQSPLGVTNTW